LDIRNGFYAIRDILPLIAKANINVPIKQISSTLVSIDGNTSISHGLGYMIHNSIRNIGIKDGDDDYDNVFMHENLNSSLIKHKGKSTPDKLLLA
jgi:CBS domain-containing protein